VSEFNTLRLKLGVTAVLSETEQHYRERKSKAMRDYRATERGKLAVKASRDKHMGNADNRLKIQHLKRQNYLVINIEGKVKTLKVDKRLYPGHCELCGIDDSEHILKYHHWDNQNMSKGLWLCQNCHTLAEVYDKRGNLLELYVTLKGKIEKGEK
jgi:hypothetical protein